MHKYITLAHGSGSRLMGQLISEIFVKKFNNKILGRLDDAAVFLTPGKTIALTTDSFTVKPLFFPGGDIGKLAVCGTVNDLAAQAARPLYLAASFIIEEGFLIEDLKKIVASMAATAVENSVVIVTGDTKVVARGELDGIFITTTGVGVVNRDFMPSCRFVKKNDVIIVSGTIAEHGMSILNARGKFGFEPPIKSDVACLSSLVRQCASYGPFIHAMRDPTRGGLAGVLFEIAHASKVGITIFEEKIPIKKETAHACELLGYDPLFIANEGKMVFFVEQKKAENILKKIRRHPHGRNAAIIGEVTAGGEVALRTKVGAKRLMIMPEGELLPRIC